MKRIGLVGARGHTGRELLGILARHPGVELVVAASGSAAGQPVQTAVASWPTALTFTAPSPADLLGLDGVLLALPNDESGPYVAALDEKSPRTALVDLSADHRFCDDWVYGLTERQRPQLRGARRIANPGCYATGLQLAVAPFLDVLVGDAVVFGVSGYSGAGTTPSRRNDPDVLHDNLLPYALTGHVHEREATRHLGWPVRFFPHVASFFRGISLTVSLTTSRPLTLEEATERLARAYADEPLVEVVSAIPEVKDAALRSGVTLGGVAVAGERLALVATLDNLLKGAAVQAIQNLNLALGLDELDGIR